MVFNINTKLGITGDIHGDLSLARIKQAYELGFTHLIVVGYFGYYWDNSPEEKKAINEIKKLPIIIYWIDGNHENFNIINKMKTEEYNGGLVHKDGNIIHLLRGYCYNICGKTFFAFGGAKSIDRKYRIKNRTWWTEEIPSEEEKERGLINLAKHNNTVDYIITHTTTKENIEKLCSFVEEDSTSDYLSKVKKICKFNTWYFGHFHEDYHFSDNEYLLYLSIKKIRL